MCDDDRRCVDVSHGVSDTREDLAMRLGTVRSKCEVPLDGRQDRFWNFSPAVGPTPSLPDAEVSLGPPTVDGEGRGNQRCRLARSASRRRHDAGRFESTESIDAGERAPLLDGRVDVLAEAEVPELTGDRCMTHEVEDRHRKPARSSPTTVAITATYAI